ncbi:MAG: succinylglutamate desuccinylase/aspartoacylase family protein [Halobacteriovoraceae bacterium]|nr:succinylglutamate desuccinylase/aspartoacylase family protein [Halobacteriovoraceae bacterium]MCB9095531.1 succinylglutamate desuccinylase/aspartoacylase family protein [Halobacteriovoraceae bacterium]
MPTNFQFKLSDYPKGFKRVIDARFPAFYGIEEISVPLYINRAKKDGPTIVVTSCIHGDEVNGLRVVMRLIDSKIKLEKGTLIAIPILNPYGVYNKSRYLPDRKDLNRHFPGNEKGSFASRLASFIMKNFGSIGDFYIDLHSGGTGRLNIPQIRYDFESQEVIKLLDEIRIPLVVDSQLRDGSFREALNKKGTPCLVFEGGEGLRVDKNVTNEGINLIRSVLYHFAMIKTPPPKPKLKKIFIKRSKWLRAPCSGFQINHFKLGKTVSKNQFIAEIRNAHGEIIKKIYSPDDGIILGMNKNPLIMTGDALYNLGFLNDDLDHKIEEEIFDWDDL